MRAGMGREDDRANRPQRVAALRVPPVPRIPDEDESRPGAPAGTGTRRAQGSGWRARGLRTKEKLTRAVNPRSALKPAVTGKRARAPHNNESANHVYDRRR